MTPAEAYVMALVLSSTAECKAQADLCTDIAVDLALTNDFSFEDRLAMRDAAQVVIRTRHPEVELMDAIKMALAL